MVTQTARWAAATEPLRARALVTATTRATAITPTSGKRVRIIAIRYNTQVADAHRTEVYFGTGANITTTAGKEIDEFTAAAANVTGGIVFNEGEGPAGAVDEVVSVRSSATLGTGDAVIITYREE